VKLEDALKTTRFTSERHKATLNLMYTAYWLKTHISQALKEAGLTAEQYNVMRILKGSDPKAMCVKDIGSRMIEKSSNVPRIIDRLVIKKLVKRYPSTEDKRETLIQLTDKGKQLLESTNIIIAQLDEDIVALSDEEAATLNNILERLRKDE
jgi:DNA-binding MarR family transcriptional regulator